MRVALVHYWLSVMGGGEKVLEALCRLYPQADIYTHVLRRDNLLPELRRHAIRTTFINALPGSARHYQKYLPLMPLALEQLDLTGYDLVISSESGPAKGVITRPDALHICYCHSPMRYLWDNWPVYQENAGRFTRLRRSSSRTASSSRRPRKRTFGPASASSRCRSSPSPMISSGRPRRLQASMARSTRL